MLRAIIFAISIVTCASAAELEPVEPLPGNDWDGAAFALASVDQVIELVRSTREIDVAAWPGQKAASDLRVSLVVLDTGPATDVSPTVEIHLAVFNEIAEFGTTWALAPITGAYRFDRVERTAPGIYDVYAVVLSGKGIPDCYFQEAVITVDARALSVDVRQAKGLAEFEVRRETTPITTTVVGLGCATSPY